MSTIRHFYVCSAVIALLTSGIAVAQTSDTRRNVEHANATLQLPADQQLLEVRASFPKTARVSSQFEYEIVVSNASENIILHDVKIAQQTSGQFEVESSQLGSSNDDQTAQNEKKEKKSPQPSEKQQAKADGQKNSQKGSSQEKVWTIDTLNPGEIRRILVTAASDQEGTGRACISVKSYTPVLCIATEFVKPELELVKKAPEEATVCEIVEYEYYIRNTGSATARSFQVIDKLSDGLRTADGARELKFTVDALEPGEARKFIASLSASKPGEYSSRATVRLQNGEEIRSQKVATQVKEPRLSISANGPNVEYLDRIMNFTIAVKNDGDAPAKNAVLTLTYPEALRLMDSNIDYRNGEPQGDNARADRDGLQFSLGTLKPGQSREVEVTARGEKAGTHKLIARADFVCDASQSAVTAETQWQAKILALPALQVYVIDEADPVRIGEQAVYHVVVRNEGDAPDHNVQVVAKLPDGLKFHEASGTTDVSAEGNELKMKPIETLEAGEKATWTICTQAKGSGEAILTVELKSETLNKAATTEEPTQLFGNESAKSESQKSQDDKSQDDKSDDKSDDKKVDNE